MSINRVNETEALGQERVGKLLFRLAAPAIAAQVINLLYNLVDRMYIGHIDLVGAQALTGLGVCLPLIMLITAFAALVSMGSAPRASIFLGKGDKESSVATHNAISPRKAENAPVFCLIKSWHRRIASQSIVLPSCA